MIRITWASSGLAALLLAGIALPALAAPPLGPALVGLSFLVGNWSSDDGKVADTGQTSKGTSVITVEAGGAALLRKDHTDLFGKGGNPAGGFDQLMMIYPDGAALHADYADGQHVIHYVSAEIVPGKSVTFTSAAGAGPQFRLTYTAMGNDALAVTFGAVLPGQSTVQTIASGTLKRQAPVP